MSHPEIVDQISTDQDFIAQSDRSIPLKGVPYVHLNRFGVIPKNHQPDKWRLIVDFSYPKGSSISDGILKALCSLK